MMTRQTTFLTRWALSLAMAMAGLAVTGCTSEHDEVPKAETKPVQAYGRMLDESASPEDVAYVLLCALAEDVDAAQKFDHDRQREAINVTFSLAAYDAIEKRLVAAKSVTGKDGSLGEQRDTLLYEIVHKWAPIVAHYVKSFDTEYEAAREKMTVHMPPDEQSAQVVYPVAHDPEATDPARHQGQDLIISLVREAGDEGREFWRVLRLDYFGSRAAPAGRPTPTPAQ